MDESGLRSYSAVATRLGVSRATVADLVKTLGITPKPMPTNGKGKGLDASDVRRLMKLLGMGKAKQIA